MQIFFVIKTKLWTAFVLYFNGGAIHYLGPGPVNIQHDHPLYQNSQINQLDSDESDTDHIKYHSLTSSSVNISLYVWKSSDYKTFEIFISTNYFLCTQKQLLIVQVYMKMSSPNP